MINKLKTRYKLIADRLAKHKVTRRSLHTTWLKYYLQVFRMEVIRKIKLKMHYKKTGLVSTNIETRSVCNRQCEFCFNHPRFDPRPQGAMPVELWQSIINQLAEIGFAGRIGPHFYNEPLLDKRLPELIEYARAKLPWTWIQINSNGDLLTEDLLLKLYHCGVNFFFVTNYDEEDKLILSELQKKYPALIKVVKNSDMWRTDRGGEIFHKNKIMNAPCLRPQSQLVVNWEGEVLLCCMDFYAETSFGNLKDDKLFKLWSKGEFSRIKKAVANSRQKGYPICHKCDDPGHIPW